MESVFLACLEVVLSDYSCVVVSDDQSVILSSVQEKLHLHTAFLSSNPGKSHILTSTCG